MDNERIYFCAVTDFSAFKGGARGWPDSPVTWNASGPCGAVSESDFRATVLYSLENIQDECGIVLVYSPNAKTANVVMYGKALDGRGKVLAQSGLPIGLSRNTDTVIYQEYDSELWSSEEIAPQGKISMPAVVRHEWGHGGAAIEHAPDNSGALMRAFMDPKVSKLQRWDIAAWQAIYGPSKRGQPAPQPTPVPTPTASEWRIKGNGFDIQADGPVQIFRHGVRQSMSPSLFAGGQ